ncbi:MAG: non-homologous end-joining DNA ligase, partial [Opitutaceae bacterium]
PQGGRSHFGAILIGYFRDGELRYAGKVGSGYDQRQLRELHALFLRRRARACPFPGLSRQSHGGFGARMDGAKMRKVTWLKPELVAQIRFTEWTEDGLLRHPVFLGLRKDKPATAVTREAPALAARPSQ